MHYDVSLRDHGLRHDPFKALVAPRPIGWISSLGRDGAVNLAPYSFFNAVADRPPIVAFSSQGRKDSLRNIEETGEFTCSLATWDLREAVNVTSATVAPGVDEFALAGLDKAPSRLVKPPRVARSPAALECRFWKAVDLPGGSHAYTLVIGQVVGVYIDDAFIVDGRVDTGAMQPIARMGYMEYARVAPDTVFRMNRPHVAADGRTVAAAAEWDGKYR